MRRAATQRAERARVPGRRLAVGPAARTRRVSEGLDAAVARIAVSCAGLLVGGMPPGRAITALAQDLDPADEVHMDVARLAAAVAEGRAIGDAFADLETQPWRVVGAAWLIAETSGAPLAPALTRIAAALRALDETRRRRDVLLAGPQLTARLVAWLPIAALVLSFVLGFDPLPLFFTPVGGVLLVLGFGLQLVGVRWTRALTARVAQRDHVAGLEYELMWIALAGGAPPQTARRHLANALSRTGPGWVTLAALLDEAPLARAVAAGSSQGVAVSTLLLDRASQVRATARGEMEAAVERLGVHILLPLACCVLPAFIALGVVPVVLSLFGDVFLA